ncbi:GNAT family N-acetyltransferase [Natronococcus sp. A-GB1]|uniref:GNAT family N-acetyltransferase n=1 Tax=Natronococcus sp. A-GB1 TaxID=3037648 RepID=UPI00241F733D|nr:GNAT family N-acetyltransferase [Natronococcus sp. A-GB1]MDG5761556.1 GNAT family N-acetyltransferase [Natronococcus sp. A-GB1]
MRGQFRTGEIDQSQVLSLLNESFGDWGDEELFQWKYDEYPGYDPDEHAFSITVGDELAAFRRIFRREFVVDGETIPIHIYGDTAVAPKYRGQGLYSELYERTKAYSKQSDAQYIGAFNRRGNLTFDANLERGWSYRTLPLRLRILSPKAVLETYASLITDDLPLIDSVAEQIGHRFHVGTSDGPLSLDQIVTSGSGSDKRSVGPALSDTAVTEYVEAVSTDGSTIRDLLTTSARLAANGDISIGRSSSSTTLTYEDTPGEVDVTVREAVSEADLEPLTTLSGDAPSFRRTREDVNHLIQYPNSDLIFARRNGALVGYAIVVPYENDGVIEGRVLEIQTKDDDRAVFNALINQIESRALKREFDLLLILSEKEIDNQWAAVDQQVLVWDELEQADRKPLQRGNIHVSFYDIV